MIGSILTRSCEDEWEADDSGSQPLPPWGMWVTRFPLDRSYFRVHWPASQLLVSSPLAHSETTVLPDEGVEGHLLATQREEACCLV
jgi:hypothetical protein